MGDWEKILRDLSEIDSSHGGFFKQALDEIAKLKQERDELAAMVEVMRDALAINRENLRACQAAIHLSGDFDPLYVIDAKAAMKAADSALSITGPDALREIQARTLEEAAKWAENCGEWLADSTFTGLSNQYKAMAAAKRKGE